MAPEQTPRTALTPDPRSGEALTTLPHSLRKMPANGAGLCVRKRWNSAAGSSAASNAARQPRDRLTWNTSPAAR